MLSDVCPKEPHGGSTLGGRDRCQEGADYSHLETPHKRRFVPASAQTLFGNLWPGTAKKQQALQQGRGVFCAPRPVRMRQRLSHDIWLFSARKPRKVRHGRGVFFQSQRCSTSWRPRHLRTQCGALTPPLLTRREPQAGHPGREAWGCGIIFGFQVAAGQGPERGGNISRTYATSKCDARPHLLEFAQAPGAPASRRLLAVDPDARRCRARVAAVANSRRRLGTPAGPHGVPKKRNGTWPQACPTLASNP